MQWLIKNDKIPHNLAELEEILLSNRGITEKNSFYSPQHPSKYSQNEWQFDKNIVESFIERLESARQNQDKIIIIGDYDADGICSTSILWLALKKFGITAVPIIPERKKHGYGLSEVLVDEVVAKYQPKIIITIDNGIVSEKEVSLIKAANIEVAIIDHHQAHETLPKADWIIHQTLQCAGGLAWRFAHELIGKQANEFLDLAAIATFADMVPLTDINRSLVFHGLTLMQAGELRIGIKAMLSVINKQQELINENLLGYWVIPRLNALGRIAHGLEAVRLLCTNNIEQATKYAQNIESVNLERQQLTKEWLSNAQNEIKTFELGVHSLNFAIINDCPDGILSLIAGRMVEEKGGIVFAMNQTRGSVRSVGSNNITQLLREIESEFDSLGGHSQAAGFNYQFSNQEILIEKISNHLRERISSQTEKMDMKIEAECVLPIELIEIDLLKLIEQFSPFGVGNRKPLFALKKVVIEKISQMGKQKEHLQLQLANNGEKLRCILWQRARKFDYLKIGDHISLVGEIEKNTFRGNTTLQFMIRDIA